MLLGGAAVNALAFSGSNYLFSMLRSSGVDEERRRHNKAVEQLQAAHEQWSKQRTERLDWINEELRRQGHAVQTFHDVDMAIREYARVTGHNLDSLGSEPQITDFYTPSGDQKKSRDRLRCCGPGCDRPSSIQTRQVIRTERAGLDTQCQLLAGTAGTTLVVRRVNFPPDFLRHRYSQRWDCRKSFSLLC